MTQPSFTRTRLRSLLLCACAAASAAAIALPANAADASLADRVMQLTRGTKWKKVDEIAVRFDTFHPQGMVKIGDDFYVSSVEITKATTRYAAPVDGYDRDTGAGQGHLFRISAKGDLLGDLKLGEGSMFHPGGIDYDGTSIWVPAAEYRPNSRSIIYRVDPKAMRAEKVFEYGDHIGGLVHDTDANVLHGVSWGSRRFYAWPLDKEGKPTNAEVKPADLRVTNPAQYIDYQDCKYAPPNRMLCSGLNAYRPAPDAAVFRLGGFELINLKDNRPIWQ
ncbi:MAG: DUF6454 family protein, partial [Variovorax sp.]